MKYIFAVTFGFICLIACNDIAKEKTNPRNFPEFIGRSWTSNFYFYRNVYKFNSQNMGICYEHQIAHSCSIDLKKYKISDDSMLLIRVLPFRYTHNDSELLITFIPIEDEKIPDRKFEIIETSLGVFKLKSKYEYAYGYEVLFFQ